MVIVLDTISGPPGDHRLEQFWHLDSAEDAARFSFSAPAEVVDAWRSRALCSREPATALCVMLQGPLPAQMAAVVDLSESPVSGPLEIRTDGEAILVGRASVVRPLSVSSGGFDRYCTLLSTDAVHLQEKIHLLARQFERGGDLFGASPRRCMRNAWERLFRLSPGLGSPGSGATSGCFCRSWI